MTDKDKEAFEIFWDNFEITGDPYKDVSKAWKAACEYKEAENKKLLEAAGGYWRLLEENKKLREALGFYANPSNWSRTSLDPQYALIDIQDCERILTYAQEKVGGKLARKILKESEE